MPKLFGLDGSTVREILKLHALDGATPRRVKKLFGLDGSTVRLIFEDFSSFVAAGTANLVQSPLNEVVDFGVRDDFNAGGADVSVNTTGTGDASNVGSVTGLSIDVDSNHTYSSTTNADISAGFVTFTDYPSKFSSVPGRSYIPDTTLIDTSQSRQSITQDMIVVFGGTSTNPSSSSAWPRLVSTDTEFKFGSTIVYGNQNNGVSTSGGYFETSWTSGSSTFSFTGRQPSYGGYASFRNNSGSVPTIKVAGNTTTTTSTGRRARVQNGTSRNFFVSGGGLTAGNSFPTGNLSAGASTSFVTADSTSEAWSLTGTATKNPATFSISNASADISVSGTFADSANASTARDAIQAALNANGTFTGRFNAGTDINKTVGGVGHKVVRFTSDAAENTSDFSMTITQNDGSNTTPHEETVTQGVEESLQTQVQVTRAVEGTQVSSTKSISSLANTDTAGAEVATLGGDISYDSGTNKLKVQDQDATVTVTNAGSLSFTKE